jgi:hypothetical protein
LGHEPLKSASFEIRISSFVPPSQIFVWEDRTNLSERARFRSTFATIRRPNTVLTRFQTLEKCFPGKRILEGWFDLPQSWFVRIFGSQQ